MLRAAWRWVDPFILTLVCTLLIGILVPMPAVVVEVAGVASTTTIALLFFLFGVRLSLGDVVRGFRNLRLQATILIATFAVFPLLGVAVHALAIPLVGAGVAFGLLYVTLLPSTLTSSAAYTSVAGGNVAGAVTAAAVSNLLGLVVTPLLVLLTTGSQSSIGLESFGAAGLQIVLPFVAGQLVRRFVGPWLERHLWVAVLGDRAAIVIAVFSSASAATERGLWRELPPASVLLIIAGCLVLLAAAFGVLVAASRVLRLDPGDRAALYLCGTAKSLGTGLPMAVILFPPATTALIVIPLVIFHQAQMIGSAVLARRLARRSASPV